MTETMVTLVGNVATGVEFKESPTGGVARFRFAVPARRWDRAKADWTDGPTSFYTVWAWRALAANLAASVSVGEPLVIRGRLRVREEERDGGRRTFVDIEAAAAGHDLTRGTSAFRRVARGPVRTPVRQEEAAAVAGAGGDVGRERDGDLWAVPVQDRSRRPRQGPVQAPAAAAPEAETEPVALETAAAGASGGDGVRSGGGGRSRTRAGKAARGSQESEGV
ncbi:single-stranded DNA-binding protein [Streptomyces fuscigenes]|nr:single-stranded DNA-binding protein [Streptomyces fuscigenes]